MPRVPDELLERLKREISLERLIESSGVTLKKTGENLLGLCPMHEDHEPSLVVTPSKNIWHCMGACRAGGSVVDWVMRKDGVSFRKAVDILLADFFPLDASSLVDRPKSSGGRQLACPLDLEAGDAEIARQVIAYYHETLKQSPEALAYLESRGLRNAEMIDRFKLGYANRTLGYRLPEMNRLAGKKIRTTLQRLGFLRESGHEHLNGSLVIPILGESGEVLGAYGRKIRNDLRTGTPDHLYLPGPHRGVFNVEAFKASDEIILCEALIDALTFWSSGFRNVTSSYGVEGFTHDHLAAMKSFGTKKVLIAYDRDEAGERAAAALAEKLIAEGLECFRVLFPRGMDANEYAKKVQPPAVTLGVLLRSAEWIGKGMSVSVSYSEPPAAARSSIAPPLAVDCCSVAVPSAASPLSTGSASAAGPATKEEEASSPIESPSGAAKKEELDAAEALDEFHLTQGDRLYRVRGLKKNMSFGVLRLNVYVRREGEMFLPPSPLAGFFVDTFDLYAARQRAAFEREAAHELGVEEHAVKMDLGALLRRAEELQQQAIETMLAPKEKTFSMSEKEADEALSLLRNPRLLDVILKDFERCGVVGEETNKLAAYLSAVSRKLDRPLAVIIQSSSAAGKSSLMEAVLALMPEEEREKYSALTANSLFYFSEEKSLKHKILAISEEQGAERATYALKLLQSEGELTIASTGKDPQTGRLVTQEYRVEGPVMIFLTTTAIEIDEELLNRCLVLTVDENREQTRRIHQLQRQRETLEGLLLSQERDAILKRHQNAQRLLRPLLVVNPFAEKLTFIDDRTRTRRDHVKYLTLIRAIALLHQHQREVHTVTHNGRAIEYVEATAEDVAVANRLAGEVLGRSLDELPPQTRRLLMLLDEMVTGACEGQGVSRCDFLFTARQVRERTGWSHDQVRVHLGRLVSLEYVLVHRGGRGQSFVYELLYDGAGKDGRPFLVGLIDVDALGEDARTTTTMGGEEAGCGVPLGGLWGGVGAGSVGAKNAPEPSGGVASHASSLDPPEKSPLGGSTKVRSYRIKAVVADAPIVNGNGHRGRLVLLNLLKHPPRPLLMQPPELSGVVRPAADAP